MNTLPLNKPKLQQAASAAMLFCGVPKTSEGEIRADQQETASLSKREDKREFATVPVSSLVWTSSYPHPALVSTRESLLLVQMLPTIPKGTECKLINVF